MDDDPAIGHQHFDLIELAALDIDLFGADDLAAGFALHLVKGNRPADGCRGQRCFGIGQASPREFLAGVILLRLVPVQIRPAGRLRRPICKPSGFS